MKSFTSFAKALQNWEEKNGASPSDAKVIKLNFEIPPIEKMDPALIGTLVNCEQLSLSTNAIEKMIPISGLKSLKILSLSRNQIKRINGLDEIGATLEELWLSYNYIEKLDGLSSCTEIKTLYVGHNKIKDWNEMDRLKEMSKLRTTVCYGNDIYDKYGTGAVGNTEARLHVLAKLPQLGMIDGVMVTDEERKKMAVDE
jgi:dynein light chain 1